jgi:hypothetical protein
VVNTIRFLQKASSVGRQAREIAKEGRTFAERWCWEAADAMVERHLASHPL